MNPEQYERFTRELLERLENDPQALGLVALGSMAAQGGQVPDRWSDHDFFLIVPAGQQETWRSRLDWLPAARRIALAFRETEHGLKVVYEDGHLLELAVFSPEELHVARVNRFRVLLDREHVARRLEQVAAVTAGERQAAPAADRWLAGQFLANLLVGAGRHARGEWLSGRRFVLSHAVGHLLELLRRYVPTARPDVLDNLDPLRRFELAWPELGAELEELCRLEPPAAALGLLDLASRELAGRVPDWPSEGLRAVRARIAVS